MMLALGNQQAVDLHIDGGAQVRVQAGQPPVVNGVPEARMRVGCGSATIGIFAQQFAGQADEVVVVDDHITGDLTDPLAIVERWDTGLAWPGQRLLMVSTTGEHAAWFVLDAALQPQPALMPAAVQAIVERIGENCEPSLCSVLFVGGAGGSLRAGVTENPVRLTRAIKQGRVNVTCGGAPAYVWPGGGITVMVDVLRMPGNSFGSVPTPAIVAPIEFSLRLADYQALGGHMAYVRPLAQVLATGSWHPDGAPTARRFVAAAAGSPWPLGQAPMLG